MIRRLVVAGLWLMSVGCAAFGLAVLFVLPYEPGVTIWVAVAMAGLAVSSGFLAVWAGRIRM